MEEDELETGAGGEAREEKLDSEEVDRRLPAERRRESMCSADELGHASRSAGKGPTSGASLRGGQRRGSIWDMGGGECRWDRSDGQWMSDPCDKDKGGSSCEREAAESTRDWLGEVGQKSGVAVQASKSPGEVG